MIRLIIHITITILGLQSLQAQFTYFNQITSDVENGISQSTGNIEVMEDGYVIWGGGVDNGELFHFVRKYDLEGNFLMENEMIFPDEYFYTGLISSFQWNEYTNEFVVLQGAAVGDGVSEGRLLIFDEDLTLVENLYYDNYNPNTYFFGFLVEPDGYIVYGEYGPDVNSEGTFIMKLDFEGNIIWNEIMQPEVYQHIYRNWSIIRLDNGYVITGGGLDAETFALITLVDLQGETINEIVIWDENEIKTNPCGAIELENLEFFLFQTIAYAPLGSGNPNVFWNKIRLSKFDPETEEIYWEQDYHEEFELLMGDVSDAVSTSDGGAVILGGHYGFLFDFSAFMMKVDAEGNEEWFKEYTYQSCDECWNLLYDLEPTADGGFIAAGYFVNYEVDPRKSVWLLKVDACGDVEWQDCTPLNTTTASAAQMATVYPNPASDRLYVDIPEQHHIKSYHIFDLAGRMLQTGRYTGNINLLSLASGAYLLQLQFENGEMETHHIQVRK